MCAAVSLTSVCFLLYSTRVIVSWLLLTDGAGVVRVLALVSVYGMLCLSSLCCGSVKYV